MSKIESSQAELTEVQEVRDYMKQNELSLNTETLTNLYMDGVIDLEPYVQLCDEYDEEHGIDLFELANNLSK